MSLKIGIIGAGGMLNYHVEGFRQAGGEIAAVADLNLAAAQRAAKEYNIPRAFDDIAGMLASGIDAVSIITPNKFHAPLAIQGLEAGLHVYCEKPPALNAAEVKEMIAVAERTGKTLMFNFNNRARPEAKAMKAYLDAGLAGHINSVQAKWLRRTGIPGFGGWFTTKALSGGGPLIDLLHMIDLGLHFMDFPQPQYVLAQTFDDHITDKRFKGPWGIPDVADGVTDVEGACHGMVRFETGQVMSFQISWAEMNKREEVSVTFQGTQAGGLVQRLFGVDGIDATAIDSCQLYTIENDVNVDRTINAPADETMGRIGSAANFVHTLEGREAPLNTPDEALKLMQIIDAAYASAASGEPVKIS